MTTNDFYLTEQDPETVRHSLARRCNVCNDDTITVADRFNVCRECRKSTNVERRAHLNTH